MYKEINKFFYKNNFFKYYRKNIKLNEKQKFKLKKHLKIKFCNEAVKAKIFP